MQFRLLGPVQAVHNGQIVNLGGIKQRAALGFLLLQPNRVVATSQLLKALWTTEDAPASARKILQNAIWGLRGVLNLEPGAHAGQDVTLITQTPGYMLRVDPDQIDAQRFQHQVERGRALMVQGRAEEASRVLREALDLWRGPMVADLAEAGIIWSEVLAVQSLRLVALEEYFEAELLCGRHHAVLGELETLAEAEPLRERISGQLMLALYRCGRQADALNVFARVRTALVQSLGLEPGHGLQEMQRGILTHDPALTMVSRPPAPIEIAGAGAPPPEPPPPAAQDPAPPVDEPLSVPDETVPPAADPMAAAPVTWSRVSVLMIRKRIDVGLGQDPAVLDAVLARTAGVFADQVSAAGGVVTSSWGPVSLALFDCEGDAEESARRAVAAATSIRDGLAHPAAGADAGVPAAGPVTQLAVLSGEGLVRWPDNEGPPWVNGSLLDECYALLSGVPAGEIQACEQTRKLTESVVTYREAEGGGWLVDSDDEELDHYQTLPMIDRERELDLLRGLLERVRHRSAPHLVTVLGEAGIGKSRFVMEFERRTTVCMELVQFLHGGVPGTGPHATMTVAAQLLAACCGIIPADTPAAARAKTLATAQRLIPGERQAARVAELVGPITGTVPTVTGGDVRAALDGLRRLLEGFAGAHPTVLVIDDLHRADDLLLDLVEELTGPNVSVPLLVVTAARPALFERRPNWGGGPRNAATIALDPLSDAAIDRLLELVDLLETAGTLKPGSLAGTKLGALLTGLGDEPVVRRRSMRRALAAPVPAMRRSRSSASAHLGGHLREAPPWSQAAGPAERPTPRERVTDWRWRLDGRPDTAAS